MKFLGAIYRAGFVPCPTNLEEETLKQMDSNSKKWISKGGTLATKAFGFALVLSALSTSAWAVPVSPELDPGMAMSAMALLGGGLAMIAGRRRRK